MAPGAAIDDEAAGVSHVRPAEGADVAAGPDGTAAEQLSLDAEILGRDVGAHQIYITEIQQDVAGDAYFSELDNSARQETSREVRT